MSTPPSGWTPQPEPPSNEVCQAAARGDGTDCDHASGCRRCLQTWGCMVDIYGFCATQGYDDYSEYSDYKLANDFSHVLPTALTANASLLTNRQYWQFRAGDATYCGRNDTMCQQCVQAQFWTTGRVEDQDSRYCVGAGGCVCIFNCERQAISSCNTTIAPRQQDTPPPSTTPPPTNPSIVKDTASWTGSDGLDVVIKLVLILLLFGLPLVVGYRLWSTRRRQTLENDGLVHTLTTPEIEGMDGEGMRRPPNSLPVQA